MQVVDGKGCLCYSCCCWWWWWCRCWCFCLYCAARFLWEVRLADGMYRFVVVMSSGSRVDSVTILELTRDRERGTGKKEEVVPRSRPVEVRRCYKRRGQFSSTSSKVLAGALQIHGEGGWRWGTGALLVQGIRLMYGVLGTLGTYTYSFAARPARWWSVPPCGHAMINKVRRYSYGPAAYQPTSLPAYHPSTQCPSTQCPSTRPLEADPTPV